MPGCVCACGCACWCDGALADATQFVGTCLPRPSLFAVTAALSTPPSTSPSLYVLFVTNRCRGPPLPPPSLPGASRGADSGARTELAAAPGDQPHGRAGPGGGGAQLHLPCPGVSHPRPPTFLLAAWPLPVVPRGGVEGRRERNFKWVLRSWRFSVFFFFFVIVCLC